ncbi:DUF930 domain-containing protein [Rhizobium sp. P40RR-XXII]|uniref:DUF930 domain-containing protein n=1 Tax=unclassified Rhizobium TaxID=2613769 RepID=UPI001456FF75|nr:MULTISPECIES: DUF930 domain-containing protein [unclassified Rhizobium]NLR87961.1 DUF930 domain-containing protein [Rhizobium sp. P28RR-XV]NLS19534.1 DUF930 domain-containing protein [Rhizobium sp. P40RR-XXII]
MEKVTEKRDREIRPGFVLSILLHVLFVAIFLLPLLPAPPEAKPEQSVNVELVPQQEEKQELATKANEKPDQPPKPTTKPDEKPAQQTAETQEEPQQPQGKKSDDQPPKQSDPQGKEPAEKPPAKPDEAKADKPVEKAEKPAPKPDDPGAEKPVEKAEQQPSVVDVPVPDMNGDQKNPTTTQQAGTSEQRNDTPTMQPNNAAAEQQAEAATETVAQAQATQQAQDAQQQADAKDQTANAAEPPASDSTTKAPSSAPDVLATKEPSDFQVQPPAASSDLKQQAPAEQAKNEAKDLPQIVVPAVKPSPSQQNSQDQSASSSQGNPTGGTALVTEAQPKSDATKMAVRAKKLYSDVEMARLSKSNYDAWKKMPRRERVSYLCRSEALAQFGHEFNAPNYVNSAFSPTMRSDTGVSADGVAVPTSKGWYRVAFRCQVDDAALKVTAFSYTNDGRVPKNQLERLGLPAF